MGVYALIQRNIRQMQASNLELEHKVTERGAEIEKLAQDQEKQNYWLR
jgi:hypothetical protein